MNGKLSFFLVLLSQLLLRLPLAADRPYDPLAVSDQGIPQPIDLRVDDTNRGREIPIRIYRCSTTTPAPVLLFSHGLGGSREGCAYLGKHWAARGYVTVYLQHPGSDTSVWQNEPLSQRMAALQKAANLQNSLLRIKDVSAALDYLESWNDTEDHVLQGRLDLERVGMSGHSYGAVTTQAVSGQRTMRGTWSFTDSRIDAAIAFSPSSPRWGDPKHAFGSVEIPWMLMTGTKDLAVIGNADMESRLSVFPALPPGGKYELVLYGAEHSAFTERALPGDTEQRNPNHHQVILALSTAFWDSWLRKDADAKEWLEGDGPTTVLEKDDRWQKK